MMRTNEPSGGLQEDTGDHSAFARILRDPLLARAGAWLAGFFAHNPGASVGPDFIGSGFRERLKDIPIPPWPFPSGHPLGDQALDLFVRAGLLSRNERGEYLAVPGRSAWLSAFVLYYYRDVERLADRVSGLADAATGRRVLDAGCGVGAYSLYYRDLGARSVIALDCREEAVELTRQFAMVSGGGVVTIRGSVEKLPLPNASIDLIHCRVVLPYVHLRRTIAEFSRVLSPGGRALLMVHSASFYLWQLKEAGPRPRYASDIALALMGLAGGAAFSLLGREPRWSTARNRFYLSYQPRRAFCRLLESHGFRIDLWDTNGRKPIVWSSKIASPRSAAVA